ncbi:MAG: carboxypeptidase-like regulatory domain-containing protein [Flavobacteriales bacterium]|nr:carboxypeptidase-like regulatory domain-containing protein [Flavobacteriales bacterium]
MTQFKLLGYSLLLLFCTSSAIYAQKTVVFGKVIDATTNEPLPFVNVAFQNSKIGTTTNMSGYYKIETYYPTDSLTASFVGYKPLSFRVRKDREQTINFNLEEGSVQLQEIVVKYDKKYRDPAVELMKKVVDHKDANNREKLDAYQYEVYNKLEFDLNNIDEEFKQRKVWKPFNFIFDNIDSTGEKTFLPVFMTESMSDYYYTRVPRRHKEVIKGTKVSGIDNESIQQFMGDMYQNINIYDNYVKVFNKSFISPVANHGGLSYHYYLLDSMNLDGVKCYKVKFVPRRDHELNFTGNLWIADTTYAVKQIEATISKNANINFVKDLSLYQEYRQVEKEVWMITKDYLVVDFNISNKTMGIYGKKTTTYKDFVINQPQSSEFFSEGTNLIVNDDADQHSNEYWNEARHEPLKENEVKIYKMIDTLNTIPAFKTYIDVIKIITTGYKEFTRIELGPYFKSYSFNPIEGHRLRMGVRTLKGFNEDIRFRGYGAYGSLDGKFKYGVGTDFYLSKKPWSQIQIDYRKDIQQLGTSQNMDQQDNILASVFRSRPANQLNGIEEYKVALDHWWFDGFQNKIELNHRNLWSVSDLLKFQTVNDANDTNNINYLRFSEIKLGVRLSIQERFVLGAFDRYSLGSKLPAFGVTATFGLKGVLQSQYEYQKIFVYMTDKIFLEPMGYATIVIGAGKIWGAVPFPILELHNGNETYFYDPLAFNLMNYYEFASDQYIEAGITHHFNGMFLNKIPLMRRLKWRELMTLKGVAGTLSPQNANDVLFPGSLSALPKPYFEMGVGIENIFKFIRVDGMWRLTNLNKNNTTNKIRNFGATISLQFAF